MSIQKATMRDIPGIMAINEEIMPDGEHYELETYKLHLELFNLSYVAVVDTPTEQNKIVGYILVQVEDKVEAHITSIAVLPEYRRQGLALRLLLNALLESKMRKLQSCSLHVHHTNDPAIALYKRMKFNPISKKTNYYNNGDDGIFMRRQL